MRTRAITGTARQVHRLPLARQIRPRLRGELAATALGAEVVRRAGVGETATAGGVRVHGHPADRVHRCLRRRHAKREGWSARGRTGVVRHGYGSCESGGGLTASARIVCAEEVDLMKQNRPDGTTTTRPAQEQCFENRLVVQVAVVDAGVERAGRAAAEDLGLGAVAAEQTAAATVSVPAAVTAAEQPRAARGHERLARAEHEPGVRLAGPAAVVAAVAVLAV